MTKATSVHSTPRNDSCLSRRHAIAGLTLLPTALPCQFAREILEARVEAKNLFASIITCESAARIDGPCFADERRSRAVASRGAVLIWAGKRATPRA
jgi:hypothetical protein